jgi:hypothetical protein
MLPFYSWNFILMIAFAIFYYRAGEFDNGHGLWWAILSLAISILNWQWLHWGLLTMLLGQILLFVGIGVFRKIPKE